MRILHIVLNRFTHDARVLRSVTAGADKGHEVRVFAILENTDLPPVEEYPNYVVVRFAMKTRSGAGSLGRYAASFGAHGAAMVAQGTRWQPDLVHAHDLNGLPLGNAIAALSGARLVYDAHELWSDETRGAGAPGALLASLPVLEGALARRADGVITVCDGIADEMHRRLRLSRRPTVLRNVPPRMTVAPTLELRSALGIGDSPVLLYQGLVRISRGAEICIRALAHLTVPDARLVFLGDGPDAVALRDLAAQLGVADRLHFHPAVPPHRLNAFTPDADVGLIPTLPLTRSYHWSLPNKLFEYLHAGLAIVASDLPEVARVLEETGAGATYPPDQPEALAKQCDRLLGTPRSLARMRANASQAAERLHWDAEKQRLYALYDFATA